ncbi:MULTISPECIES: DUF6064 family protein [Bradyrhizobium]|uniref:DUF6064 family protein n=1 Tax=Bradyrhizobium TaxID=374 RepID=UPI001B89F096|nr:MULTISPECIES: DUF6064 family protein [Bradyrhizobium]MBR0970562.1 hypothetical protein [Bradyrhizobium japonicum]
MLPFTEYQFLAIFASYNQAIWPAQVLAYLLGGTALVLLVAPNRWSDRVIAAILAVMWAWTGVAYHLVFFATINKAAILFGALFVLQAAALIHAGLVQHRVMFRFRCHLAGWIGLFFVTYSALLYPLIGLITGHSWPELPMFGVTPCPVTIFTFGMLLLTRGTLPAGLLIIPVIWSLIGGSAAILLRVPQDWLLLASGVMTVALILIDRATGRSAQATHFPGACSRRHPTAARHNRPLRNWWRGSADS